MAPLLRSLIMKYNPDKNTLFLSLLVISPFLYFDNLFDKVDLPRFAFIALLATTWLLTWLATQTKKSNVTLNWNPLYFFIIFLLFYAAISMLWGGESHSYQAELYFFISLSIICFMGMQLTLFSIDIFSKLLVGAATVLAIIGILQSFNISPIIYKQIAAPASTFINKNYAANFFDLILPVALISFLISKNSKEAWLSAIAPSLIISYIVLTKTRGAYLATVVSFFVFLIAIRFYPALKKQSEHVSRHYKKQIIFIIIIPFILFFIPSQQHSTDSDNERYAAYFSKNKQNSISVRLQANQNAFDLFKEHPIAGVGLAGFQQHFRPYTQSVLAKNKVFSDFIYLHNEPLQAFIELGLIGGITIIIFLVLLFRTTLKSLYNHQTDNLARQNSLSIGYMIALVASLTHSLFSFPLHQPISATFFALYVGILLSFSLKTKRVTIPNNLNLLRYLTLGILLIYLAFISEFYSKYIQSSYYMNTSAKAFNLGNCKKAIDYTLRSNNTFGKDYLSQSQAIHVASSTCPINTKTQLSLAENVLKFHPNHPTALFLAGMSHYKLGNVDQSYKMMKSLSFLYPYFTGSYTFLGHIALKKKHYKKAKLLYQQAFQLEPNNKAAKHWIDKLEEKGY